MNDDTKTDPVEPPAEPNPEPPVEPNPEPPVDGGTDDDVEPTAPAEPNPDDDVERQGSDRTETNPGGGDGDGGTNGV